MSRHAISPLRLVLGIIVLLFISAFLLIAWVVYDETHATTYCLQYSDFEIRLNEEEQFTSLRLDRSTATLAEPLPFSIRFTEDRPTYAVWDLPESEVALFDIRPHENRDGSKYYRLLSSSYTYREGVLSDAYIESLGILALPGRMWPSSHKSREQLETILGPPLEVTKRVSKTALFRITAY